MPKTELKPKAHRFFYDLEVLPYNFTNAFVNL